MLRKLSGVTVTYHGIHGYKLRVTVAIHNNHVFLHCIPKHKAKLRLTNSFVFLMVLIKFK